jgi:cytochrome c551/c552
MKNHILIFGTIGKYLLKSLLILVLLFGLAASAEAQRPKEEHYMEIAKVAVPEGVLLEVGGLAVLPNGDLGVSTRRGDVYIIENPTSANPYYRHFAHGLHEILGLAYKDGSLYAAQRGELTRLEDTNKDGKADVYETIHAWPLSAHYHEYSFGPKIAPDGTFFVSGNVAFGNEEWWRGESRVPWRGWMMKIDEAGKLEPWATGMRSPAGLGMIDGELFYTDNQGDWMGSGGIWHVEKGDFMGHPAGLRWTDLPNTPVDLSTEELYAAADPRQVKNEQGRYIKPENIEEAEFNTLYEMEEKFPEVKTPAVWLPHGILGISNSEIIQIPEGHFGPFEGQLLVGDQGQSKIMRVAMEKVKGEYQGVAFDFRSGFQSGVLRMAWAKDGSLFVGETNRGWGSAGSANEGLQRLVWKKRMPFEMKTVKAMPDGFEIEFTKPVDPATAEDLASYDVYSYIYKYHPVYGSPPVMNENASVKGVKVSEDGMKARIVVDGLRQHHVHTIRAAGIRDADGHPLLHPVAYYTLNNIPDGSKLSMSEVSTTNSHANNAQPKVREEPKKLVSADGPADKLAPQKEAKPTYAEIEPLLVKNTCNACHQVNERQVGPAFIDVAKRNYSDERIVELIYNPEPENWPDYTEMMAMPQVPRDEALKIAAWINSLDDE